MLKVRSIGELGNKARTDNRYLELAFAAAETLGGHVSGLDSAIRWLNMNADETSEEGVVEEINFVGRGMK